MNQTQNQQQQFWESLEGNQSLSKNPNRVGEISKRPEPRGNSKLSSEEIERSLTQVIRPKGQINTRGLHLYDLLGKGVNLKLQNAKRNQIHKNTGSVGGDANAVLALAYRRHGNGCRAIAEKIGASSHTYVAQIFRSLDLGALPMEERKNMPTLTEEERAQRIYEDLWMREVRSVRKDRTWAKHPDSISYLSMKRYYENPQAHNDQCMKWRNKNRHKLNANRRAWMPKYYKENPSARIADNLRARLSSAVKRAAVGRKGSAVKDLGCSLDFLMSYLETRFDSNMSWENYGSYWHIDHVLPLASFDLTKRAQLKAACHYTNLQPMEASANMSKCAKVMTQGELI